MKKLIFTVGIILVMLAPGTVFSADWYVDNKASGANDGTTWSDAWQNLSNIDWSNVDPGDTVYVSGGASQKTYNETLIVQSSGTAGNPITITVGEGPSHSGVVRILAADDNAAVIIQDEDYINLDGQSGGDGQRHIHITDDGTESASGIYIRDANNVKVRYVEIYEIGSVNNDWHSAIQWRIYTSYSDVQGVEFAYNSIHSVVDGIAGAMIASDAVPTSYSMASIHHNFIKCYDDDIASGIGSLDIYNNVMSRMVDIGVGHPDGIQLYSSYYRIFNNYFWGFEEAPHGNAVLYWEPDGANNMDLNNNQPCCFQVYNNVFYENRNASDSMRGIQVDLSDPDWISLSDMYILNNYFEGDYITGILMTWPGTTLDKADVTNFYIMNNVFYNAGGNGSTDVAMSLSVPNYANTVVDLGSIGDNASITIDFNVVFGDPAVISYQGKQYSHSEFVIETGCQDSGITVDPSLNENHAPNEQTDPVVETGYDWSSLFTTDMNGTVRDVWDIGPYQFDAMPPANPAGLTREN